MLCILGAGLPELGQTGPGPPTLASSPFSETVVCNFVGIPALSANFAAPPQDWSRHRHRGAPREVGAGAQPRCGRPCKRRRVVARGRSLSPLNAPRRQRVADNPRGQTGVRPTTGAAAHAPGPRLFATPSAAGEPPNMRGCPGGARVARSPEVVAHVCARCSRGRGGVGAPVCGCGQAPAAQRHAEKENVVGPRRHWYVGGAG